MVARTGELRLRRFAQAVPGRPTRSSHRHGLASEAVVFANRTAWRPNMAHTALGTSAAALSFTFSAQTLRVIMRDGEPWFVAADVCEALTISNNRDALCRLDDDEKGVATTDTPGGQQEMTIINESGLYSLILTSRKPEAKKFKKWVTSEVLPAIRKTGRYEVHTTQTRPQAEKLNATDMAHIKRVVYFISDQMRFKGTWTQAAWFYLRKVLSLPYPNTYTVDHIPLIAVELRYIVNATQQVNDLVLRIEREAAKRIFRKGECAKVVVDELEQQAHAHLARLNTELNTLPTWLQADMLALERRSTRAFLNHEDQSEQPDFFGTQQPTHEPK